ncbi:hypothetical protein A5788_04580 [Gordonia sp. 852002-50816_SCH5313054-c]|uniref:hypothetical protein n=1 Tax=unclassified Gordonia (in: high G+C Gram-positive bacteria) TaxID=2657482 RepID=UPI0007EBC882|nr:MULTISPECIES: hypothetical protein [unclassified Gordonia (in: high G+C Gram-positive bacteria)]OBC05885.1 hypothetical protein A5786_10785 [Gordonia sp. 852002-50816_SCH5313054-a]OBC21138.1 hypothetical protein A5788_04580 [Gordonia sp. 852002-50816_SCH5313054-c]
MAHNTTALDRVREAFTKAGRTWQPVSDTVGLVDLEGKPGFARFTQIPGHVLAHVESTLGPDVDPAAPVAFVLASVGLTPRDLFDNRRSVTYVYPDRTVPRYVGKAAGSFIPKYNAAHVDGDPNPLYNRDALTADPGALVYVTEGEKDCDAITSQWGSLATTAPHGANSPHRADWSPLAGHPVVIVADNDTAGNNYARDVWGLALAAGAVSVSVVHAAYGKDAADHIAAGLVDSDLVDVDPSTVGVDTGHHDSDALKLDDDDALDAETAAELDQLAAEVFWSSSPALDHIRRCALAQSASPYATLLAVLARLSSVLDPGIRLPAIVGGRTPPLNIFAAIVGDSGGGKGVATSTAEGRVVFVNAGSRTRRDPTLMPIPTGEGLARFFAGDMPKPAKGDETAGVRQPRDRGFIAVDEVETFVARGSRQGATLLPTLRSAFNSGVLGSQNADTSSSVTVPAGTYTLGMIVECQPEKLGPLLNDPGGTAQRFLWAYGEDETMPPVDEVGGNGSVPPLEVPIPWVLDDRDPADRDGTPAASSSRYPMRSAATSVLSAHRSTPVSRSVNR